MERTKQPRKPDLILTSDWHLREDTPICWKGNFLDEQTQSIGFVGGLQSKYNCPVVHAGDLFHHWKPSPWLLSYAIDYLPLDFYTIYGQHDLPQHNWELREKCGIFCLERAGSVKVLNGCHYGQEPNPLHSMLEIGNGEYQVLNTIQPNILVWHHLTYKGNPPFPGAAGGQASVMLRKYPQFDLIVTGDNHQSFTANYGKQLLVNPGSLTRQKADQIDFEPRVYLWYAEDNTVEPVYLPIAKGVISREHIDRVEKRDERIDAFISKLDDEYEVGVSFEENLEEFFQVNNTEEDIKQIIYKSIE